MKYDNYFFVVDTETGGIPKSLKKTAVTQVALVEMAFVVVDNEKLKIVDKKNWLFKPYKEDLIYTEKAAEVSGISRKFAEDNGLGMEEAFKDIVDFIKKYHKKNRKPILVGHNLVKFDLEFIANLFSLNNLDASKYFDENIFDTLIFSRLKFVQAASFKLSNCCQLSDVTLVDAHRAMNDTISTARLWINLLKSLRGKSQGQENISQLIEKKSYKI